jgi:hypothetical protein
MWKVFDSLETEEILGIELGGNFYSVGGHDDLDDDLDAIKLKIPSFLGKKDPEALCGIGGHGPYSNKGGEADKEKGQYMFSDQFGFIFLNMEAEFEERRVVQPKPYAKAEPPNSKKDAHTDGKGKFESQPTHDRDIKCLSV